MRKLRVAALLAAILAAGCSTSGESTTSAELSDRYPSTTAAEWVTYSDFVGVVTVAEAAEVAEVAAHDRPRFEPGHRYVVAFVREPARCYEGDGGIAERWVGLGAGSALPYDGEVLGGGEFAGAERTVEDAEEHAEDLPPDSVAAQATGEPLEALRVLLAETQPEPEGDLGPQPSTC